jgi:hypothetical protein
MLQPRPVQAELTPTSPDVQQAVTKALEFLGQQDHPALGGNALVGLAVLKATDDVNHPIVQKQATATVQQIMSTKNLLRQHNNYSVGIGIIFLAQLDPLKYREPLELLLAELGSRQMSNGAWGYEGRITGDTSMTQYAVLGMWEAARAGYSTPVDTWEKVANWLLRTQDPSGGFGYQAKDPESFSRVQQSEVRHSLTAGGLASVYLCADYLGFVKQGTFASEDNLPSALRPVAKEQAANKPQTRRSQNVDASRLADTLKMGELWFDKNWLIGGQHTQKYFHYYLYALERYETFREAFGGPKELHDWYQEGAKALLDTQSKDGAWYGETGSATDTAFSVLFLTRSTRKALGPRILGGGSMVGGRGIPKSDGPLRIQGGDIVAAQTKVSTTQLLAMIEGADDSASVQAAESIYQVAEAADESTLSQHALTFKHLVGNKHPEARVAAVKALGRLRNLDDVPTLLYAISDPDTRVVIAAVDALRYISRQPYGSPGTVVTDAASRDAALDYWKRWYRTIRPDADLSGLSP